jgi:8-amino-7-oxononanoate synthase
MSALDTALAAALDSRADRLILRRLPAAPSSPALIDFASNDYLSLSSSPTLRTAFISALSDAPVTQSLGAGGSRLLVHLPAHTALEHRLATFFSSPSALLFNSGFDANAGFFACIPQKGDVVLLDEYIHASVHDGVRASRAQGAVYTFAHNDIEALGAECSRILHERPRVSEGKASVFIAVESLYSMDGTFAPLREIVETLERRFPHKNAHLVVDEAHATGIYGSEGRGLVAHLGLENRVFARLHTFGKALAGTGGMYLPL